MPLHRNPYGGSCGHRRQCHRLHSAPIARPQVLQTLQALRRSFIAHVEPQRLMGLAVVYDRLFIAVEGQRTQLVRDLFTDTEYRRRQKGEKKRLFSKAALIFSKRMLINKIQKIASLP